MDKRANRRIAPNSHDDVLITFGMIVLNGEPFVAYNLRALYPFAHQIIVVEGAAPAGRAVATPDGHSSDGTLETLRRFKANEDPQGKLQIVTAEDNKHVDGFWEEKDEMSHAYATRATGNYLWQIDADEFYLPEDISSVIRMLTMDTDITAVSFYMRTFWGAPAYEVDSFFLRQFSAHRLFAWGPGYEYVTHRPPTVLDEQRRNLETLKPVTAAEMKAKGIFLRHYELLFPKQVAEKSKYYAAVAWTSELKQAEKWLETCYNSITRPFRVHMAYSHISWLEHFTADHPPQIGLMMHAVTGGFHEGVSARQTSDIESLLSSRSYRVKRAVLRRLIPIDKFLAVMKAALRRILERTALWRALQRVKRVVARTGL